MTNKINVYAYHWEIHKSEVNSNKRDKIFAWCLDRDSNPVLLRFETEPASFYIHLPEKIDDKKIYWEKEYLKVIDRIKWGIEKSNKTTVSKECMPIDYRLVDKQLLCYYQGKKTEKLLYLEFNNINQAYEISNFFYRPVGLRGLCNGTRIKYEILEKNIDSIRKMMTRVNCGYCQWFEVEVNPVESLNRVSTLKQEYIATSEIKPIDVEKTKNWGGNPGVFCYDIECITDNERMPDPEMIGCPIVSIACSYKRCYEKDMRIINLLLGEGPTPVGQEMRCFATEKDLVESFFDLIAETNPEIVIGYNIYGFDNDYVWKRAYMLDATINPNTSRLLIQPAKFDESSWSSKAYGEKTIGQITLGGRIDIDVLFHVRANYKLPSYSLDNAAKSILGERKYDLPYKELFRIFRTYYKSKYYYERYSKFGWSQGAEWTEVLSNYHKAKNDLTKAIEYGATDTILTHRIFDEANIYSANREVCNLVGINIQDVLNRGQQIRGLRIIYDFCHRLGIVLNKVMMPEDISKIKFKGGFVFDPIVGMHDDVICIDFNSLYPSIIIAMNLCFSTMLRKEDWHTVPIEKCNVIMVTDDNTGNEYEFRFVKAEVRRGILPLLLAELLANRYKVKGQIKFETSDIVKAILDKRQLALKVTANSIYGLTGVTYNKGVLPFKPVSLCTTAVGRNFILKAAKYVEDKYNGVVVYGDTDSIMFKLPGIVGGPAAIKRGFELADEMSDIYPDPIKFECEKVGRIICIVKKKYMYWKYDDRKMVGGKPNPKFGMLKDIKDPNAMELRGNVLVRRDNCSWYKKIYR